MLGAEILARVRAILEETRADLVLQLLRPGTIPAARSPTEYDVWIAREKLAAIDRELARLEARLLAETEAGLGRTAQEAADDVTRRLRGLGIAIGRVGVDPRTIALVQGLAGSQIRAVTAATRARISVAIHRAVAGSLSVAEVQREIGAALGVQGSAARIDRILRTEINRAYTQSEAAANERLARTGEGADLVKYWIATKDTRTRDTHAAVDGQERELSDPFRVGLGATASTPPGGTGYPANAPLDPSLPPEEGINCRCSIGYRLRSEARQPYIRREPAKP